MSGEKARSNMGKLFLVKVESWHRIKRNSVGVLFLFLCVFWFVLPGYGRIDRVSQLIRELKHWNWDVRKSAAGALGAIKDPRAVEPLITALKDRAEDVRRSAVSALGAIGAPAVEPLITALKDPDKDVRKSAANALGETGDSRGTLVLFGALLNNKPDPAVVIVASRFFIERGETDMEEALIQALKVSDDMSMANEFLNCGNSRLAEAAREGASAHGYKAISMPGLGRSVVRWGSRP
jgi:HEAT repeat protein